MEALQLVGAGLQVVELCISVVVLDVLVAVGPDSLPIGFFGLALGFALAFAGRFLFIVSTVFAPFCRLTEPHFEACSDFSHGFSGQ